MTTANRVVPNRYGVINIGKLKENLVTEVNLPAPGFAGGSYAVLLRRPKEEQPYPVSARHDGSSLIWTVQTADTAIAGMGKLECRWYGDNGEVAKSQIYTVRITDGLPDPTEAPEAWAGFMQQVSQDAGRAESAADNAAKALKKLEDGIASGDFRGEKGEQGEKGDPGPQGPQGEPGPAGDTTAADAAAEAAKAAAQEAWKAAEASAGSAAQAAESVGGLADDLEANQKDIAKMKRAIKFQAELNQGQTWDFEEDTQTAYQRIVPSGAKAGAVMEWGGKTVGWNQKIEPLNNDAIANEFDAYSVTASVKDAVTVNIAGTFADSFNSGGVFTMDIGLRANRVYLCIVGSRQDFSKWPDSQYRISLNDSRLFKFSANNAKALIFNSEGASAFSLGARFNAGTVIDDTITPGLVDLTSLYGPGNEPTDTSDPRIAQIEAYAAAHPEYNAGELVSALVDEVRVTNAAGDSSNTYPIPSAVRNLPGYGWSAGSVANTVERTDNGWQYVQRVGSVDLGTLDWYDGSTGTSARRMVTRQPPDNVKIPQESSVLSNLLCTKYAPVTPDDTWLCVKEGIALNKANAEVLVYDSAFATAESLAAFKAHVTGVPLYYELATPITTDITALMGDSLAPFSVESGGSITLHHPKADEGFAVDVPAKIQYITKLSEVSANG